MRTLGEDSEVFYVPFLVLVALMWPFSLSFLKRSLFGLPHSMWDLHSPTRDQTLTPCSGSKEPFFFFPLIYLFLAALGLHYYMRALSSCREWWLLSDAGTRASLFGTTGSRALGPR